MLPLENDLYCLVYDRTKYWEISPSHVYWLTDINKDFKQTLQSSRIRYRISGAIDLLAFKKAVYFLLQRHESLRASFRRIEDKYYMSISEVSTLIDSVYSDTETVIREDYVFDLQKGPLVKIQIIKEISGECVLDVKVHHIICDEWSIGVLKRDLLTFYIAFAKGLSPDCEELKFQYKHYMYLTNQLLLSKGAIQRQYWSSLYKDLPGELVIPGRKKMTAYRHKRNAKKSYYKLSNELIDGVRFLAAKHNTSLFIILQALFKSYIHKLTGQRDIAIGTMCFGREYPPGADDQVGCYAFTDFIRTVLDLDDSIDDAIQKVKRSNYDMKVNSHYNLMSFLSEFLPPGGLLNGTLFWKINLHYSDVFSFDTDRVLENGLASAGITVTDIREPFRNDLTDLDMKIHFLNSHSDLKMMVHYDSELYELPAIDEIINGFILYLKNNTA